MKLRSCLVALLCLAFVQVFSQENKHHRSFVPGSENSTGTSGTGANINVTYHKIYWRINPDSTKYIKGFVQTNFVTITNNVSSLSFDLNDVLVIDSVRFHNALLPAGNISRAGNIATISLGTTLGNAVSDSIRIYYQGVPPAVSGARQGYQIGNDAGAGAYVSTLSESYEDRDWWPCKADMQDKVDSMDIEVNVPWNPAVSDTFWVATNGKLIDSTISGTNRTFLYKTKYPIASYLVFVSVGRFNRFYPGTINVNGTNVPVVYYLLAGKSAGQYSSIVNAMNNINAVVSAFSTKYGDYPFKLEKHGYYDGLMGAGGMEHQTMSGIASGATQSPSVLSHELMHQWYGDNVTFSTWNDLWLAEGFADYGESLAAELVPSLGMNAHSMRLGDKNSALNYTSQSVWIPNSNTTNSNTIWSSAYGGIVYTRGAMMVAMLRAIAGDQKFFQATTAYQQTLAGKSATSDSLKRFFNDALGQDITPFFNDYVGGSGPGTTPVGGIGNPQYSISWSNPSGTDLLVSVLNQTRTSGSNVSYFRGPVALHIKGSTAAQDTSIVFFDWGSGNLSYAGNGLSSPIAGNLLNYHLSFVPVTVVYDDSAKTLSTGTTTKIIVVDVQQITSFTGHAVNNTNEVNLTALSSNQITNVELYKSNDGVNFTLAGNMDFIDQSGQSYTYKYIDASPFSPNTFYRAKVYYAATFMTSADISVARATTNTNSITITPNPVKNIATIHFNNPNAESSVIRVLAADGKKMGVYTSTSDRVDVDVSRYAAGVYIIQLYRNGKVISKTEMLVTR